MSINSMTSSAGRVVGPPLFGYLYTLNVRFPYRSAAVFTAIAALVYFIVDRAAKAAARPEKPLAAGDVAADEAKKRPSFFLQSAEKAALGVLAETLRTTIMHRGYDLSNSAVVELIQEIIETSLPPKVDGRTDEELLGEETHFLHEHLNREHADHHPHT